MSVDVWASTDDYDYRDPMVSETSWNGFVACVYEAAADKVYFKHSQDGTSWGTFGDRIEVGTVGGAASRVFHVRQMPGTLELRIFNGIDRFWKSLDRGRTWTAL